MGLADTVSGVGNRIADGKFWDGFRNGAITGGTMAVVDARKGGYELWSGEYTEKSLRRRFKGIPDGFEFKETRKNDGYEFVDPKNDQNRVRIMMEKPNSPNPSQQKPYYRAQMNGQFYDVNGFELHSGQYNQNYINQQTHSPHINYKRINLPKWKD